MSTLPLKLYTAQAVRELDRIAINSIGIDGLELMSRAGQAAYRLTQPAMAAGETFNCPLWAWK